MYVILPILLSVPELWDEDEGEEKIPAGTRLKMSWALHICWGFGSRMTSMIMPSSDVRLNSRYWLDLLTQILHFIWKTYWKYENNYCIVLGIRNNIPIVS